MTGPFQPTVEVATFKDKATGKFSLAIVYIDRNGEPEIMGMDYANMDQAKSAAWQLAQQLNAVMLPTRRVRP